MRAALSLAHKEEALEIARGLIERGTRRRGADDANVLFFRMWQGQILNRMRRYPEAEACLADTLQREERLLGADHLKVAFLLSDLAEVVDAEHRAEEADAMLERALRILAFRVGRDYPLWGETCRQRAAVLVELGRAEAARALVCPQEQKIRMGDPHPG